MMAKLGEFLTRSIESNPRAHSCPISVIPSATFSEGTGPATATAREGAMRVLFVEWVPVLTMRLLAVRLPSASQILFARDGFQMIWIHAGRIATQMIQFQFWRNWAFPLFIGEAMRQYGSIGALSPKPNTKIAVTVAIFERSPQPAGAGSINLCFESGQFSCRHGGIFYHGQ